VRVSEHVIEQARRADLLALVEQYTSLKKNSRRDRAGPCPRCGGTDRFHVFQSGSSGEWRWRCYQCHEKPADAIAFLRWLRPELSLADAVSQLTGDNAPVPAIRRQPPRRPPVAAQPEWRKRAERIVAEAHERLWKVEGEPGRAYLEGRGLEPQTWLAYGVGYRSDVAVPGTDGKERAPAIVLPWYAGGRLVAVRYRFLSAQGKTKLTAESGSQFAGKLFGGQALPRAAPGRRTLIIVEGEINAMSIWQVCGGPDMAHDWRVDVLSVGSESAKLTPAAVAAIGQYGRVFAWMDRAEVARGVAAALANAYPVRSPGGSDANDLLQKSLLGGFLAMVLKDAAQSAVALEELLGSLWDTANSLRGLDSATACVCEDLATRLGKRVRLVEAEPGRWITTEGET
jgi:phage/plasmid primase-like uncharacterized protein